MLIYLFGRRMVGKIFFAKSPQRNRLLGLFEVTIVIVVVIISIILSTSNLEKYCLVLQHFNQDAFENAQTLNFLETAYFVFGTALAYITTCY